MKEKINELKARVSMVWHALTARNCVVAWSEGDEVYSAMVVNRTEWPSGDISVDIE